MNSSIAMHRRISPQLTIGLAPLIVVNAKCIFAINFIMGLVGRQVARELE